MSKLKVVEIFSSIEGEGIRQGYLCTFIRLYGCNLRCSYCDSSYACTGGGYKEMEVRDIVEEVKRLDNVYVTITGGEPLIHDLHYLAYELAELGCQINLETNGAVDLNTIDNLDIYDIVTMDWKSISSGCAYAMHPDNLKILGQQDVLKFVVGGEKDLEQMVDVIMTYAPQCKLFVSPVFGKIEPKEIVEFLKKHNRQDVRLQLQIHKFIWDKDTRGV